jgi:hypothetical protein
MPETRTVTTITFRRQSDPVAMALAGVIAAVFCVVVLAFALFPEPLHFDGMIGPGCDASNSRCTYSEWRKGCSDEQVATRTCDVAEYHRKGGSR